MPKYRLKIAYDGTQYGGWQVQPNALTIQEVIQKVLAQILQGTIWVTASGRTDAGVHALAQVAHFQTEKEFDTKKLHISLNQLLPVDIRILELEKAPDNFHARYDAKGKCYHYHLTLTERDPFTRLYSTYYPFPIDLELLRKAAALFVGTHDFTSFANDPTKGSVANGAVRTITRLDVIQEEFGIRLEFEGDGFLYKMVRNIVGTLLEVARYKRPIEDIERLFLIKDRRASGRAAPPQGLFLVRVDY